MSGHKTRLDGTTLVVRFQRRDGRKRTVAPDGSEITPTLAQPPADRVLDLAA